MSTVNRRFPNVVIRASAGTGKTFQLSNRFIGLAAAGEPLDTILATTFTRKAAGEILDRVLTRLAEAALNSRKLAELARHVGDSSLDRARCLDILHNLLRQLHRIRVGTLDHFFIQIARSFSLDLGLPPGWRIVDETVDHRLRAEAIRRVLEDKPTQDTVRLMHLLTKGEASRSVSRQIASLVDELYSDYLEAPAGAWESLPRRKQLTEPELEAARNALVDVAMPEDKRFFKAHSKDWERIEAEQWEDFVQKGLAVKVADGSNLYYGKRIQPDVVAAYEPFIKHAKAVLIGRIANQTEATHNLLARFDEAYEQLKFAERAMRFEDVTRKLGQAAVADRLDDVVYRLDAHLAHLLLDEFQDTAPSQWRVLRPFARRVVGHSAGRSFFCVGDLKQAIYGWRGGVAEIFEAIGEELDDLRSEALSESYRSCPAVIDTVNRVFEGIATNAVLQRWPNAAAKWAERFDRHTTARTDLTGYCEMVTAPEPGEDEDRHEQTVQLAADRIGQLYRDLPDYGIGVLVRKNATVARLIYELRHRGIPASEEGGNPLTDSPAVQVLLSLLRLADHPGDTAARFHLAGSPLAGRIVPGRYDDTAAARRLSWAVRRSLSADGYGPTLYAWTKLLAPACDARDLNRLVQLVELAYAYESGATGRTDDFAQLVSRQRVEDPTTARVRVMTFHQAKGLQFDVVVLPELDTQLSGMAPQLVVGREGPTKPIQRVCRHVAKDIRPMLPKTFQRMFDQHECRVIEESLCVLYVAITRAKHALHVIIAPSRPNERNLPGTASGVLRAALTDGAKAPPETVLYRHGDPAWFDAMFDAMERKRPAAEAPPAAEQPLVPQLAESPGRPSRGLDRQSPSQLEGGARVDLAARMRLDTAEALLRGTLVHAWFEQIEWLEDGPPDDDVLRRVADMLDIGSLDVASLIRRFRAALGRPAVRAVLSRATYRQAAGDAETTPVHAGSDVSDPQWKVWREKTFALRDGDAILTGAIDRLVVLHDGDRPIGADVLDFKTDAVAADDPRAIDQRVEVYRPQLEAYRRAVSAMLRLDPAQISTRLLFVEADTVRTV